MNTHDIRIALDLIKAGVRPDTARYKNVTKSRYLTGALRRNTLIVLWSIRIAVIILMAYWTWQTIK
jgi:hypothetical protein